MQDRTPRNLHAEWRNTQQFPIQPGSDNDPVRNAAYNHAYDAAFAEMWKPATDFSELVDRIVRVRAWIRTHDHLRNAGGDQFPAVCGQWDAYTDVLDTWLGPGQALSLCTHVRISEALAEGRSFAADVAAAHAAIAADETIDPAERLRILAGMAAPPLFDPPLFDPPPVRPDCPWFCRQVHAKKGFGETEYHSGDVTVVEAKEEKIGRGPEKVQVALRLYEGDDEPVIELLAGDVELFEDNAFRLGVELIRRVGALRRMRQAAKNSDQAEAPVLGSAHEPGS